VTGFPGDGPLDRRHSRIGRARTRESEALREPRCRRLRARSPPTPRQGARMTNRPTIDALGGRRAGKSRYGQIHPLGRHSSFRGMLPYLRKSEPPLFGHAQNIFRGWRESWCRSPVKSRFSGSRWLPRNFCSFDVKNFRLDLGSGGRRAVRSPPKVPAVDSGCPPVGPDDFDFFCVLENFCSYDVKIFVRSTDATCTRDVRGGRRRVLSPGNEAASRSGSPPLPIALFSRFLVVPVLFPTPSVPR
jgi:hypothetical protein